jgi:hypothetical protein
MRRKRRRPGKDAITARVPRSGHPSRVELDRLLILLGVKSAFNTWTQNPGDRAKTAMRELP